MQFKNIIAVISIAATVSATPVLKARSGGSSSGDSQQCGNGLTAKCCNSVSRQVLNLIPINVGIGCLDRKLTSCPLSGKLPC